MLKRAVIKTVLICFGIFLIFTSIFLAYVFSKFPVDSEKRLYVAVAAVSADEGDILNGSMVAMKPIRESAINSYMLHDLREVVGKRLVSSVRKGDFITNYKLSNEADLYTDDERILAIELSSADRVANIVAKGSYVDIILKYDKIKKLPDIVLSKVKVEDLIDTNGKSVEGYAGNKTLYARLRLGKQQRERLYAAADLGQLFCEAYGSEIQKPQIESFEIPSSYYNYAEE